MFSTIIVNDSKKVQQRWKSEMEMQTFVNLGIAVRDMIDTMYRDNKKGRKLALKLFTEGFNKTMGESTILKIREEGRHLNE